MTKDVLVKISGLQFIDEKDNGSVSERELLRILRDMGVVFE